MDTDVTPPSTARIADNPAGTPFRAGLGRLIAVTGTEPELGISSFALALAEGFGYSGSSTLTIDANPERGGLQERLKASEISQVSVERLPDEAEELTLPAGLRKFLARSDQGVDVLGSDDDRPLALDNDQLGQLIDRALSHWETVIVDCGPRYAGRLDAFADSAQVITLAPRRFRRPLDGLVVRTGAQRWPRDRRIARNKPVAWASLGKATHEAILDLVADLTGTRDERYQLQRILNEAQAPWRRRARIASSVAPLALLLGVGVATSQNLPGIGSSPASEPAVEHQRRAAEGWGVQADAVSGRAAPPKGSVSVEAKRGTSRKARVNGTPQSATARLRPVAEPRSVAPARPLVRRMSAADAGVRQATGTAVVEFAP